MRAHPFDPVRSLDWAEPITIGEHMTLRNVARVLTCQDVGVVIVELGPAEYGIISEHDIAVALANGADPDLVRGNDVCSVALVTAKPDDRIIDIARRMETEHVRHVVIVDIDEVVGLVSALDLLAVMIDAIDHRLEPSTEPGMHRCPW